MEYFQVVSQNTPVGRVAFSPSFWFRLKGLLGRNELPEGEGLWLKPCNSIHMFFMRFPIDAIFLDRQHRVIALYQNIQPWRISGFHPAAQSVLELPSGTAARHGIKPGNQLALLPLS